MKKQRDPGELRAVGPPRRTILEGDAIKRIRELPTASVDCVVTSPPYFRLRDYGVPGQLGQEDTIDQWADKLADVMRELSRVLKQRGGVWLNLGDSYARRLSYGTRNKGLLLGPERLLLRLSREGWLVRSKVIWAKPNPLPNPVLDRLTMSYEVVYFLTRSSHYYFDLDAIRVPFKSASPFSGGPKHRDPSRDKAIGGLAAPYGGLKKGRKPRAASRLGKNPGDVWIIPTPNFRGPHYATFPEALARRPILATCPEAICSECGQPWKRTVSIRRRADVAKGPGDTALPDDGRQTVHTRGPLEPCGCGAPTRPGVVLDPFFGSGTVGLVAEVYKRDWIGIELNHLYSQMAMRRIEAARSRRAVRNTKREAGK